MILIGCIASAQSGKDEFAKIAVEEFNAIRVAFADAVKEEAEEFLKDNKIFYEHRNLWGSGEDKEELFSFNCFTPKELNSLIEPFVEFIDGIKYVSFRSFLQVWGTEYRRSQDPSYWVKRGLAKCCDNRLYTFADCRFMNEINAIKAVNGKLIKIIRPDAPSISNASHKSEQELKDYKDYDYLILNNGTLEEYRENCRKVIKKILEDIK